MSKAGIWFLVLLGCALLIVGLVFDWTACWIIGLVIIAGTLYLALSPNGILRQDEVLDTWSALIGGGQGQGEGVLKDTETLITESKAPLIKMEKKAVSPGFIRGLLGVAREFLVITDHENNKLKQYQIFINARNYGNNLDIAWYLTYKPSIWQSIMSLMPFISLIPKTLSDLDLFDQQDLRAYVTNAHSCLLQSTDKLMLELHQDPSKMDRKSRGFLGIS